MPRYDKYYWNKLKHLEKRGRNSRAKVYEHIIFILKVAIGVALGILIAAPFV